MDTKEKKTAIDAIINNTFKQLLNCYNNQENNKISGEEISWKKGNSRLIFPKYGAHRNDETRISEQELRFVFVEEFNKYCEGNDLDWFYSVETPTKDIYIFSESEKTGKTLPRVADEEDKNNKKGQSASFDLVIHDSYYKRIALIEFKALNPAQKYYEKDYLKLNNEGGTNDILIYFVMLLESYDDGTEKNIERKLTQTENNLSKNKIIDNVIFYCCSLEGKVKKKRTNNQWEDLMGEN